MRREKPFMTWLDDKVEEWGLAREVEEEFNRLMIHQRIADLRERAGLSQEELAKRTGVSQPMIAKLESGRASNLTIRSFIRYALALGYAPKVEFVPMRKRRKQPQRGQTPTAHRVRTALAAFPSNASTTVKRASTQ